MERETRLNLIFLAVFLAISLPGAVILFKKKLDPNAAPMYLPDPVRQRLPYMAPQWTPDEVVRVIPQQTGQWVEQITREQGGGNEILLRERLPILSADRLIQVAAIKSTPTTQTFYLIAWDNFGTDARHYDASLIVAGQKHTGKIRAIRNIPMPQPVHQELLTAGYVKPRHWIAWIELEFTIPPPNQPALLQVSYNDGANLTTSSVNLFTQ